MTLGLQARLLRRNVVFLNSVFGAKGSQSFLRFISSRPSTFNGHNLKKRADWSISGFSSAVCLGLKRPVLINRAYTSTTKMPPVAGDLKTEVQQLIDNPNVVVFSKTTCPFCTKAKDLLKSLNVKYDVIELDKTDKGAQYQAALLELTQQNTVPNIFIKGQHLGGHDDLMSSHGKGQLLDIIEGKISLKKYDFDLAVIGGGSGGLAAAKRAAELGMKVTLFDFVKPSPAGSTWGLGGTCVNVGCIPKKLMHRAAVLGEDIKDAQEFGWSYGGEVNHDWEKMRNAVQDHVGSMNWGYRVQLRDKKVTYQNAYAEMIDEHTIKAVKKNKAEVNITADKVIIATGERPRYPDIPGAKEYCITSDDLFALPYCPGKTLCIGASYVSLECAGFLAGFGLDTTVMVRSILLRGFDQQCAEIIGKYMEDHGVKFVRGAVPTKIEQIEDGKPGKYRVTAKTSDGKEIVEEYNTILLAIGRDPCTQGIGLENAGVKLHEKTQKVIVNEAEQTNKDNIYAIGDIGVGRPELTPVAIQAGKLLSQRLFGQQTEQDRGLAAPVPDHQKLSVSGASSIFNAFTKTMRGDGKDHKDLKDHGHFVELLVDYTNIATTVFTPLEYGCIGYSEEAAIEKFGENNIEVYHSYFMPLEWTVPHRAENTCYAKLVCLRNENDKVIGFHVLGPNAGEMTQGFAVAMKAGVTKSHFDATIGIHPTCAETFTTMHVTKRSGASAEVTGC